ncbi:MAG: hypothetical protein KAI18_04400, partial [Candidatus Aenigmarchaeota archaeon]|nr:hypothetical protein [Candidatus Aenigmarchaeota archaeon]
MEKEKTTKKEIEVKNNTIEDKNNQKQEKTEEKPRKDFTKPIVLTIFIILILGMGWVMLNSYNNSFAKEQCLAIQNHPELNYPCTCYPSEKPTDLDPFVDENTEEYCRCDCDIGN